MPREPRNCSPDYLKIVGGVDVPHGPREAHIGDHSLGSCSVNHSCDGAPVDSRSGNLSQTNLINSGGYDPEPMARAVELDALAEREYLSED